MGRGTHRETESQRETPTGANGYIQRESETEVKSERARENARETQR